MSESIVFIPLPCLQSKEEEEQLFLKQLREKEKEQQQLQTLLEDVKSLNDMFTEVKKLVNDQNIQINKVEIQTACAKTTTETAKNEVVQSALLYYNWKFVVGGACAGVLLGAPVGLALIGTKLAIAVTAVAGAGIGASAAKQVANVYSI